MIVADAAALVELLLGSQRGKRFESLLDGSDTILHAPHLVDLEVAQVLRRLALADRAVAGRCQLALERFLELDIERWPHEPLLPRIWAFRHQLTAYDASYVVVAQALECDVLTIDGRLSRAHGLPVNVRVL